MGCPSAAIVFEELIQLGATRLIRVGTCGGLQPTMRMADTVIAVAATPEDRTVFTYTNGEPHAPTASWSLVETALRLARERGASVHVGPIVSSAVFYDPDPTRSAAVAASGATSGVEMEAAVLYTIAAIRGVEALAILTVSDIIGESGSTRISDEELKRGVDDMMRAGLPGGHRRLTRGRPAAYSRSSSRTASRSSASSAAEASILARE